MPGHTPLTRSAFAERFGTRAVFAMVHLQALPGAPLFTSMNDVIAAAMRDAEAIVESGASGMVFENFGDVPFAKKPAVETIAAMATVVSHVTAAFRLPFGINVLRNDGCAALAIAAATGAAFVRVNVLTGAMVTDQGIIEGEAAAVLRKRRELGTGAAIFADFLVKHATPLGAVDPTQSARDLRLRGLADAVVVSGSETGKPADPSRLAFLDEAIPDTPLVVGSGLNAENARSFPRADAAIVGTAAKREGRIDATLLAEIIKFFRQT